MGQNTKIEWAHHTFNPWRGCTKVSAGCAHCYADRESKRNPKVLGVWGKDGTRVVAAEAYWRQPLRWNRDAAAAGERHRVFCASLADVFEGKDTMPAASLSAVRTARVRLFDQIRQTPSLDWLLLTKRPENVRKVIEETMILAEGGNVDDEDYFVKHGDDFPPNDLSDWLNEWTGDNAPPNVWLGASVEDQTTADERIPHLLRAPAVVRLLSIEPLLGPVDLGSVKMPPEGMEGLVCASGKMIGRRIDWVIVGGESGPGARPMHPDWSRSIRDGCIAARLPFHFKQWGEWIHVAHQDQQPGDVILHPKGKLRSVPYPSIIDAVMRRVGKKAAGRTLDGRTWDELPRMAI